jgi:methylmalonyl-CoA mutase N-terminal domain/subunit
MVAAIESGWVHQQIADAAWQAQLEVEARETIIVGVNEYLEDEPVRAEIHRHVEEVGAQQVAALERLRRERNGGHVARTLSAVRDAGTGTDNLLPPLIDAVKAYATVGEICDVLREVFGEYQVNQVY